MITLLSREINFNEKFPKDIKRQSFRRVPLKYSKYANEAGVPSQQQSLGWELMSEKRARYSGVPSLSSR